MIRPLLLLSLCASVLFTSGCLFSRKAKAPKESSAISSQVEADFHKRWMDQRSAQLVAQGIEAGAAAAQAQKEYEARFIYTRPAGAK